MKDKEMLIPFEDEQAEKQLREKGFRYIGARETDGKLYKVMLELGNASAEEMDSFFDVRARDYDLHMRTGIENDYEASLRIAAGYIFPGNGDVHVLDLGCGTGGEIPFIYERVAARVTCIDMSEGMLDILRSNYSDDIAAGRISVIQGSYTGMEFGASIYDYCIACNTLHHLLPHDKFILYARIRRALKPGGRFIICDYYVGEAEEEQARSDYLNKLEQGQLDPSKHYHIDIPVTLSKEKQILREAGFANILSDDCVLCAEAD